MTESTQPTMETLFKQLDRWRNFAGYPLEARVDAVFSLFLTKVIEDCCGVERMHPQVIPQFPLKKEDNNRSDKVDFFALSKDIKRAFLIELKTDMGSQRKEQNEYLVRASEKGMASILSDFKNVAVASNSRRKYFHLISALSDMGVLGLPNKLEEKIRYGETRDSAKLISEIEVIPSPDTTIEVLFVQPKIDHPAKQTDFQIIPFAEFAAAVEGHGELGRLFASYLRQWEIPPGQYPPKKA